MIWLTIIVFIGLLLLLVLVHELGHLLAAKRAGCTVEEFGFGFPPRLWSVNYKGTRYSLNLLPLGGFVKIEGEDMENTNPGPGSFASKSVSWRILILVAGVLMNVALAVVLLGIQAGVGFPTLVTSENQAELVDLKTYVVGVLPNSPAEAAGLKELDRIVELAGVENPDVEQVLALVDQAEGKEVVLEVERQGQHQVLTLTPRLKPPEGEGALGIQLAGTGLTRVPWWQAPWAGVVRTAQMLSAIASQFGLIIGRLMQTGTVGESLTGPVGIAIYTNEVTKLGFSYILEFGALISLNLALINILPIPALDGGRILFVLIEKIRGRRLAAKVEQVTHTVGFVALIGLMILITVRDIQRFF
jgi:regulator of sigma E protease